MRPIVGGNADGEKLARPCHTLSQEVFCGLNRFTTLAGVPATMELDGTSPRTKEFAPMIAPFPIEAGPRMTELSPIHTLSPMITGPPPPNIR